METIQLMIEIPKDLYEKIDNPIGDEDWLRYIIKRGVPIPKGHGRIIDADALKLEIIKASNLHKTVGETINDAPTIIEADRNKEV